MKKPSLILLFLVSCLITIAQTKYEPQVLILAPGITKYEKSLAKELAEINAELQSQIGQNEDGQILSSPEFLKQPENFQLMIKSEQEFLKQVNFFKLASSISEQFLIYRFYEKFPNSLIKLKNATSDGTLENLKGYAAAEQLQYVLNFSSIELYKKLGKSYSKMSVQLYDSETNSILLNKTFVGDSRNPGFEFSCKDKSLNCTMNNALAQVLAEVIGFIASNSPTLQKEKQLQQERVIMLSESYFVRAFDKEPLKAIISPLDSNINLDIAYQGFFNSDKTKFVAFFLQLIDPVDFQKLRENNDDKNVNIISSKDIGDENFLDDVPQTYAYVVKGVKYKGEWYYEKSNVTYFDAPTLIDGQQRYFSNLLKWNFFKANSTDANPEFWETKLFEKVPDLTKDPHWEEGAKEMWKADEINNKPYIGMYEIVVGRLRKQVADSNLIFEAKTEQVFKVAYQKLKLANSSMYAEISAHSVIFPQNKLVAINPVLITNQNGQQTIHYFVLSVADSSVYEWEYFEPLSIEGKFYGEDVVKQIGSLTDWNFSIDNLDDMAFWDKYVFLKADGKFRYLKRLFPDGR